MLRILRHADDSARHVPREAGARREVRGVRSSISERHAEALGAPHRHVCAELNNNVDFFEGSLGLNFPSVAPKNLEQATFFYWLYLLAGLVVLLIAWQIRRSRFGAGLLSIREDEDTARMLGVPTEAA